MEDHNLLLPHSPTGLYNEKQGTVILWKSMRRKAGKMHNNFLNYASSVL
jgi:hypothetical protein